MMRASSAPCGRGSKNQKFSLPFLFSSAGGVGGADKKWKGNFWFCFAVSISILYFITPLCQGTTLSILKITIMSDSSKKLALNMKKIRTRKHMSQGDICRELGVDRAYISTIESGKQNPTLSTIERIAKALGVSVDELLK
jgi:DNA-binding XRE family transcriptional regulator